MSEEDVYLIEQLIRLHIQLSEHPNDNQRNRRILQELRETREQLVTTNV